MGKQGPCCHCGVTSTPLWRNGPPEKPVLCNACGSRWRTKGTLVNYTPLHARPGDNLEDTRFWKLRSSPLKNKEPKIDKRKFDSKVSAPYVYLPDFNYGLNNKGYDEDTSNRSSSGSAISNPESYTQFADANELTDPSQHVVWDSTVPSRKRTCVARQKPSPVEKLTKDLYNIWHEQRTSCLSEFSEEDLLFETDKPMVSVEIGHGSVLMKHPSSIAQEEESVASSLTFTSKHDIVNSRQLNFHSHIACNGVDSLCEGIEQIKNSDDSGDKDPPRTLQLLTDHNSPLCNINLEDIVNFDNFAGHLANDEQQLLLRFLPEEDISDNKDTLDNLDRDSISMSCLKSVFDSPQFKVDLLSFKTLLEDGIFDEVETEDIRVLKKFILCDFTKWNWVEQYKTFKDSRTQNNIKESKLVGLFDESETDRLVKLKRPRDVLPLQKHSGQKAVINSQRGIITKVPCDHVTPNDAFLSSKHLFPSHNDSGLSAIDGANFLCESSDNDLLLDIPSNGSFPQAELLLPT